MPRRRGRSRGAGQSRDGTDDESQPELQPEEDAKVCKAAKGAKDNKRKPTNHELDVVLSRSYPNAVVHEDYACILKQRDIRQNTNKFYVIQVAKNKKKYIFFTRWGRVGKEGQSNTNIFSKKEEATKAFEKKFNDKTKNNWADRDNFEAVTKKYKLLEVDEDLEGEEDEEALDSVGPRIDELNDSCCLHPRTRLMIEIILSDDMFINQMANMNLNLKKMTLDKLSKAQISEGLEILVAFEKAFNNKEPLSNLRKLSDKFYALIRHNFGRGRPPLLQSYVSYDETKMMMYTLRDIELAQRMQEPKGFHSLFEKYEMLDCSLEYIDKASSEFKLLNEYKLVSSTRKDRLLDAWRVDRRGEKERFAAHEDITHRMLLWRGTNVAEVAAILKEGLRMKTHSREMLGTGISFTPEYDKSAFSAVVHPFFESELNVGFMFLVEVALGRECNVTEGDFYLTEAPEGYDSVVCRGASEPDPKNNKIVVFEGKDVIVRMGKPAPQEEIPDATFFYTQYMVYKESQARIRYMLKLSFDQ